MEKMYSLLIQSIFDVICCFKKHGILNCKNLDMAVMLEMI